MYKVVLFKCHPILSNCRSPGVSSIFAHPCMGPQRLNILRYLDYHLSPLHHTYAFFSLLGNYTNISTSGWGLTRGGGVGGLNMILIC